MRIIDIKGFAIQCLKCNSRRVEMIISENSLELRCDKCDREYFQMLGKSEHLRDKLLISHQKTQ